MARNIQIPLLFIFLSVLFTFSPSQAADRYATASGGATSGSCPIGTPCTLSYAISGSTAGDTIIVNPGNYSGSFTLNKALTITSTTTVISDLGTFTRGIPTGTDNRPIITGSFTISAANVTFSYVRVTYGGRADDLATMLQIDGENALVSNCRFYNGHQGIRISMGRLVTIQYCLIEQLGQRGTSYDAHGIGICRTSASATSWTDAIRIQHNTIHDTGGDSIQDQSSCTDYGCSGQLSYLIVDDNEAYDNDEECMDMKGTNYLQISNNDFHGTTGQLIQYTAPTDDCTGARSGGDYWYIYGNTLRDNNEGAIGYGGYGMDYASNWVIYNNLIYNVASSCTYTCCAVSLSGANGAFYENVLYNSATASNNRGGICPCANGSRVKNNIFYNNAPGYGAINNGSFGCTVSGTPTNNYIYPSAGVLGSNYIDTSDGNVNSPGLTNPSGTVFTLKSASVCKDYGATLGSPYNIDILGYARPYGSAYDLGAYEYGAGPPPSDTTPPTVTITTTDPTTVIRNTLAILGTATDAVGVTSCKWRLGSAPDASNGMALTGTTAWSGTVTGLSYGSNTLYVGCSDAAGNWGSDSMTVEYRTVATPRNAQIILR